MAKNTLIMTVSNLKLGMNQGSTTYGPFSYGSHTGEPVVDFAVSEADQKKMKIQSIDSMLDSWNWKRKLSSGFARLQFNGQNVFKDEHAEGISELSRILDARFVDFQVERRELNDKKPPRELKNIADYYRVFVPKDHDFDEDVFEFFVEQSNRYGNVDFVFKVDNYDDDEYVSQISRSYNIYDSHIWLYPKGWKLKTVSERMEHAIDMSKGNTWNLSPRLDITANAQDELPDEE
jgi:hypothetical protein